MRRKPSNAPRDRLDPPVSEESADSHLGDHEMIPLATLVLGRAIPFDLLTEIDGSILLYRERGTEYGREQRRALRESGVTHLLIRRSERERYFIYLAENLHDLLTGEETTPGDVYDTSVVVAGRVLEEPASCEARRLARPVIDRAIALSAIPGEILEAIEGGTEREDTLRAHSMRVCLYGLQLAHGAGIDDPVILSDLGLGLLLHGVAGPDGRLPDSLGGEAPLGPVAEDVIRHHRERLDGSGPRGLAAGQLSVSARIAAVADEFDHRTVGLDRSAVEDTYEALRRMITDASGAFDPALLATFVRHLTL
ncbi:MAG: HD-GYP domain-containing protein [Planctomycetota bacterium]|jgi:hypothetical protein